MKLALNTMKILALIIFGMNIQREDELAITITVIWLFFLFIPDFYKLYDRIKDFIEDVNFYKRNKHRLFANDYVMISNFSEEEKHKMRLEINKIEIKKLENLNK